MKHVFSTLLVLFLALQISFAQGSFTHGAGAGYGLTLNVEAASPLLFYAPRYNFMTLGSDNASLAVGTHVALGAFGSINSFGESTLAFGFDLPVTVSANFGHFATPDSDLGFGGFVGAGMGYSFLTAGEPNNTYGPVAEAGLRAIIFDRSYTVRASYLYSLREFEASVLTIGLLYNFGAY